jgi:Fe-S-cluster containining protein
VAGQAEVASVVMDMHTIIADWKANAERHADRNFRFLRSLKMKNERAVDRAARELHDEAFSIIDCIQCANCCKTVSPLFLEDDIRRIAKHLGLTEADFKATYLRADEDGDLCLKILPCPFLAEDGHCIIYEVRPKDCAEYPHTRKREFATRTHLHAGNTLSCPAVFWIVEELRARRFR